MMRSKRLLIWFVIINALLYLFVTGVTLAEASPSTGVKKNYSDGADRFSYIEQLIIDDSSISFDPETQSIIVIDVSSAQSKFLAKMNIENVEEYLHAYDEYWFQIEINGSLFEEGHPYYYIDNETKAIEQREARREIVMYQWSGVAASTMDDSNGVIAFIVNRGDYYTISSPTANWYYTGYAPVSPYPYIGSHGFVLNPLSNQDAFGKSGSADEDVVVVDFNYEWDLVNEIILDISAANPEIKIADNAGYADIDTEVTLKVELRDSEGNIFPLPKRAYHVYSFVDWIQYMPADGILIVKVTSDDDYENKYGRSDFFIPIGYDYRITVLDYGEGFKGYGYAYNYNQEYENDSDGFCIVEKDLLKPSTGTLRDDWGTDEELIFMPTNKEIRIEKIVENYDNDATYVFQVTHIVPTYKDGGYDWDYMQAHGNRYPVIRQPDKQNVLSNYFYELFDSETDEPIPSDTPYKTDDNGCLELGVGQYAIIKTWELPQDIWDYTSCWGPSQFGRFGTVGFEDMLWGDEQLPTETRYIVEEISHGDYSTSIIHEKNNGEEIEIEGNVVDDVFGGDSIWIINRYAELGLTGNLTVSKTVAGTAGDTDQLFTFTLTLNADDTYSYTGSKTGTIASGGTVQLKHGESITITGIPEGTSYTVLESTGYGYEVTTSGNTGTIVGGETATAAFTNTKNAQPEGSLTISKTVSGTAGDTDQLFTFTVTLNANGTYSYTGSKSGTIASGGTVQLKHGESITITGLPEGTSYTVVESNNDGYTVTKSGDTGTITADTTVTAAFTNTKNGSEPPPPPPPPPADPTGSLTIGKKVTGELADTSKEFPFKVEFDASGTYSYRGSKSGKISSGDTVWLKHGEAITIRSLPAGTKYLVTETEHSGYHVESSNAEGTIAEGTRVRVEFINHKFNIPATGDDSRPFLWIGLMLVSMAGVAILSTYLFKKEL